MWGDVGLGFSQALGHVGQRICFLDAAGPVPSRFLSCAIVSKALHDLETSTMLSSLLSEGWSHIAQSFLVLTTAVICAAAVVRELCHDCSFSGSTPAPQPESLNSQDTGQLRHEKAVLDFGSSAHTFASRGRCSFGAFSGLDAP